MYCCDARRLEAGSAASVAGMIETKAWSFPVEETGGSSQRRVPPAYPSGPAASATSVTRCSSVHSLYQVWPCREEGCGPAPLLPWFCPNRVEQRLRPCHFFDRCSDATPAELQSAVLSPASNGTRLLAPSTQANVATGYLVSEIYETKCHIQLNLYFSNPNRCHPRRRRQPTSSQRVEKVARFHAPSSPRVPIPLAVLPVSPLLPAYSLSNFYSVAGLRVARAGREPSTAAAVPRRRVRARLPPPSGVGTPLTKDKRTVRKPNACMRKTFVCLSFVFRLSNEGVTNAAFVRVHSVNGRRRKRVLIG